MANISIARTSQSLEPGDILELFILDLTPLGIAEHWTFTSSHIDGASVYFGGIEFRRVDVETDGWEHTGQGPFPRPKVTVTNVLGFFNGLVINHKDAVGAKFTRIRTYKQFLDGQPEADHTAHYEPDIYNVERKVKHTKSIIQWQLSAAADQEGITLPKRKMYRNTCTHSYRIPRAEGGFDYSQATCPYVGGAFFDEFDQPTADPKKDRCSLSLTGCRCRFKPPGSGAAVLPMQAFPGLIRTTIS